MATRIYLHDAAPAKDPGETERSASLPSTDVFQDYAIGVKSMDDVIGVLEASISGSATANTVETVEFFTSFSSPDLVTDITAQTWEIGVQVGEQNAAANSRMIPIVYVFREPSTVVGFIIDSHTEIGTEWNSSPEGRIATFSGAAVTVIAGDYLVLEFWRHTFGQAMSMGYSQALEFDGTTDIVDGITQASAASYLETPQDNLFTAPAASHDYIPHIQRTARSRILTR